MNRLKGIFIWVISIAISSNLYSQNDTYAFKDKNNEYDIQLPNSWIPIKAKMVVQFTVEDPAQRKRQLTLERITLYGENKNWNTQQLGAILLTGVKENEAKGKKMKLLSNKVVSINGVEWENLVYTSKQLRFDAYNVVRNGIRYSFYYIAPQDDFTAGQEAANKTIRSFRFKDVSSASTVPPSPEMHAGVSTNGNVDIKPKPADKPVPVITSAPPTPSASEPIIKTGKFSCDTSHKPYKYHTFIWEGALDTKNKTGISVIGKLPAGTALQAFGFPDKQQLTLTTGKSQRIDDEGVTYDYTNVYNFPPALDKRYRFGEPKEGLMAIRSAKPFEFSMITVQEEKNMLMKERFTQQINQMVNAAGFKTAHIIGDQYYQDEFNKYVRKPVKKIEKVMIPDLDCYLITLEENNASFISVNDKLYLLSVKMDPDYKNYFYKLNNNYFINQFGGTAAFGADFLLYEIRDTGIREEWVYNSNIEHSNFGDAPNERARARKMRYQPYK